MRLLLNNCIAYEQERKITYEISLITQLFLLNSKEIKLRANGDFCLCALQIFLLRKKW